MSETEGDYRATLLYRNSMAAEQSLNEAHERISRLEEQLEKLRQLVVAVGVEARQTQHQVNVMWVKTMGHGSTSGEE